MHPLQLLIPQAHLFRHEICQTQIVDLGRYMRQLPATALKNAKNKQTPRPPSLETLKNAVQRKNQQVHPDPT